MTSNKKSELNPVAFSNYPSPEFCHEMVAVCAYYKAEKRGFSPGHELQDWYEAEQEINKQNFFQFQT